MLFFLDWRDEIYHYGVKGMRWGRHKNTDYPPELRSTSTSAPYMRPGTSKVASGKRYAVKRTSWASAPGGFSKVALSNTAKVYEGWDSAASPTPPTTHYVKSGGGGYGAGTGVENVKVDEYSSSTLHKIANMTIEETTVYRESKIMVAHMLNTSSGKKSLAQTAKGVINRGKSKVKKLLSGVKSKLSKK